MERNRFGTPALNATLVSHAGPPQRASAEELQRDALKLDHALLRQVLDGVSIGGVILNQQRQILFANVEFTALAQQQPAPAIGSL